MSDIERFRMQGDREFAADPRVSLIHDSSISLLQGLLDKGMCERVMLWEMKDGVGLVLGASQRIFDSNKGNRKFGGLSFPAIPQEITTALNTYEMGVYDMTGRMLSTMIMSPHRLDELIESCEAKGNRYIVYSAEQDQSERSSE